MNYLSEQKKLVIGYQGVAGAYSHEALLEYFGDGVEAVCAKEFEDVFKLLKDGKIDYGVLPIENSSTGGISDVMDLLYKYDASVVGEKCLRINHNLISIEGASIEEIEEVYSHPQGFQQSREFLKEFPHWKQIPYYNTAKSVEFVKNSRNRKFAAIASKRAAALYNMNILKQDIHFNTNNYTRFVVISNEVEENMDANKLSVILSLNHSCGALYNIVKCIAEQGLNMMKIESRPILSTPWQYLFYIDFQGNLQQESVKQALEIIKNNSIHFKLLGNYISDQDKL
jgi:chorismate mutase/prephenate dehydratase